MNKASLRVSALVATLGLGSLAGSYLWGGSGSDGLPQAEAAPRGSEGTRTVTLKVEGMTCSSCGLTVRVAIKKLDGVKDAKVNVPSKEAVVEYDPAKVTPEKIVEAINKAGYAASLAKRS